MWTIKRIIKKQKLKFIIITKRYLIEFSFPLKNKDSKGIRKSKRKEKFLDDKS